MFGSGERTCSGISGIYGFTSIRKKTGFNHYAKKTRYSRGTKKANEAKKEAENFYF